MNGEGMTNAHSTTKDFIEVDDCPTQLKTADSISKLKGYLTDGIQTNVRINLKQLTDQQLRDIIDGILTVEAIFEINAKNNLKGVIL